MGPVRRSISLVLALVLTATGWGGLAFLLFYAAIWRGWMLIGATMMGVLGLYWLWADFIDADPRTEN
jgi:hypothetical protein